MGVRLAQRYLISMLYYVIAGKSMKFLHFFRIFLSSLFLVCSDKSHSSCGLIPRSCAKHLSQKLESLLVTSNNYMYITTGTTQQNGNEPILRIEALLAVRDTQTAP